MNELGLLKLEHGDAARARELFERAIATDPSHPALWCHLASSLNVLGLKAEERAAIERALALEPRHIVGLLQKAALMEEDGEGRRAARVYRDALALVPPDAQPPPKLAASLERARAAVLRDGAALAAAIDARQDSARAGARAEWCIDLLTGRRARYLPQPTFLYFPGLPALEFFENGQFAWIAELEGATDAIRAELATVLAAQSGLEPYVAYPAGTPLEQWRELNNSRRWSAYFLWKEGVPQGEHLTRCPRTAELLKRTPQCDVAGHGPNVFFSILDARTHIPPHTGVTNARLTVHLPLIVPPQCGFRVGSQTREWVPGKAWVFDDTIEHEAWNRSDNPRAVLIFDIWNPFLTEAERAVVRAGIEAVALYYGAPLPGI